MPQTAIWQKFGAAITLYPDQTLAAFLGDPAAVRALHADAVGFPMLDDFRQDRVFHPNPFHLDLPPDLLETELLVQSLAVWGPQVLLRAACCCASLQIENQTACQPELIPLRDAAVHAAFEFLHFPSTANQNQARKAAEACIRTYAPYESDPDSPEAHAICADLGAPWYAAECAAQDVSLQTFDGRGPREASPTWCKRNSVWPSRAAEAAASWTSHAAVQTAIRSTLSS